MNVNYIAFAGTAIRTFAHDGARWFVLPDLCRALGIAVEVVYPRVEDYECTAVALRTAAGEREVALAVNVPGLYGVLSRCPRRSRTRVFRRWMATLVLPSLPPDDEIVLPAWGDEIVSLPPGPAEGLTSTTQIADDIGYAPSTLGRLAGHLKTPEHGEFRPAVAHHSNIPTQQWWWNKAGRYAVLKEFYWPYVTESFQSRARAN